MRSTGTLRAVLALLLCVALDTFAMVAPLDVAALPDREGAREAVTEALRWRDDAEPLATLASVRAEANRFVPAPAAPGYGQRENALWFRLDLVNGGAVERKVLAEAGFPKLDFVDASLVHADGRVESWSTGDARPWSTRPLGNPRFSFPFVLAAGEEASLFLRVQSGTVVMLPLSLYEFDDYVQAISWKHAWQGVFYGLALGLMAYAFLFRAVREVAFAWYIAGCLLGLLYFLSMDGYLPAMLPEHPVFAQWLMFFGGTASVACILQFTRRFLELPPRAPRVDRVMRIVAPVAMAGALLVPLLPAWLSMMQMIVLSVLMAALMTVGGLAALRSGLRPARWLLVAVSIHLVVLVLVSLGALAIVPGLFEYADLAHRIGFEVNLACFTLAIGERIRLAEDEGRQASERALAAAADIRARNEFLSRMSHELRTPMTGVLGMAELLDHTPLEPPQRRYLSALRYSAEMLLNLINDVLDHVRLQAGTLRLSSNAFDLLRTIDECRLLFEQQPRDNGVTLHIDVGGAVSRVVVGDGPRVRQVLVDLLACAFRFTTRGSVLLRVQSLPQAGWLRFEVEAGGRFPVDAARLFELFPAMPSPAGGARSGTGIGLAISRELVESMGGHIGTMETGGEQTLFWFELPLNAAVEGES